MKIVIMLMMVGFSAHGQLMKFHPPPPVGPDAMDAWRKGREKYLKEEKQLLEVKDPWRVIGGATNRVSTNGWMFFSGKVLQVHNDGIRVEGRYGNVGEIGIEREFYVKGFPYEVAENEGIGYRYSYAAKESGTYSYTTVTGADRTLRKLDYGICWTPPPPVPLTQEQQDQIKRLDEAKKKANGDKALAWNQSQAEKGDAFGQYRMGVRYLKGEGVAVDPQKAREWFAKSAAQGNADAKKEMEKLASK